MGIMDTLKSFDAYPKTLEDFRVQTKTGAVISVLAGLFVTFLIVSELGDYLSSPVHQELHVDTTFGEKLQINLDITFPRMPCDFLSVDVMDISGEHQLNIAHNLYKKRLGLDGRAISGFEKEDLARNKPKPQVPEGAESNSDSEDPSSDPNYCGSCYGAEQHPDECCNTCDQVRAAYRAKGWAFVNHMGIEQCVREGYSDKLKAMANEGCSVSGHLTVNKVAGNFHIAPGSAFEQHHTHIHDLQSLGVSYFNFSHEIHRLSFGKQLPGIKNALDGAVKTSEEAMSVMYQYHVKVVPTTYTGSSGRVVRSNQYSVTEHQRSLDYTRGARGLPGIFIMYDFAPLSVTMTESTTSFAHFLVSILAVVGGVVSAAGLIDGAVYSSLRTIEKKMQLGKQN